MQSSSDALQRAINYVGGQTALAALLSDLTGRTIRQSHVHNWLVRNKKIPAEICGPIQIATNGRITRAELRPDLFAYEAFENECK